jgi:hypothetical protein
VGKVKAARSVGEGLLSQRGASHGSDQRWRDYEWWGTILFQAITNSFLKHNFVMSDFVKFRTNQADRQLVHACEIQISSRKVSSLKDSVVELN